MSDIINEESEAPGGLLGLMEQNLHQTNLIEILRQYLPDFSLEVLADSQQRAQAEQQLSGLSPPVLYGLHQHFISRSYKGSRFLPDEIVEKTWGTIRDTDEKVLREIFEDEEYCGY